MTTTHAVPGAESTCATDGSDCEEGAGDEEVEEEDTMEEDPLVEVEENNEVPRINCRSRYVATSFDFSCPPLRSIRFFLTS